MKIIKCHGDKNKQQKKKKTKKHKNKNEVWQSIINAAKKKKIRQKINDLCYKKNRSKEETMELHQLWNYGSSLSYNLWLKQTEPAFNKFYSRTLQTKPTKYNKIKMHTFELKKS